jgi:hypothetical protein
MTDERIFYTNTHNPYGLRKPISVADQFRQQVLEPFLISKGIPKKSGKAFEARAIDALCAERNYFFQKRATSSAPPIQQELPAQAPARPKPVSVRATSEAILAAARKRDGAPPEPTGLAAQIIAAGRKRRGEDR